MKNLKNSNNKSPLVSGDTLTPFDFQLEAIHFALKRLKENKAVYLAMDPGLGKTIVACLLADKFKKPISYICPPSLKSNVLAEFKKWCPLIPIDILGDSELTKRKIPLNSMVFIDEAHRFKNEKSQRTRHLLRLTLDPKRVVLLSGTPLPNSRPVELWTILKHFAPDVFGPQFFSYARKYCGAKKNHFGWQFEGFTSRDEFKAKLFESFMLRQKKSLINLPEKREGLFTVGEDISPIVGKLEVAILKNFTKKDLLEGKLADDLGKTHLHIAEYLRVLGKEKLKHIFPVIDHLLFETKEKIILFAHHKEVIEGLKQYLIQFNPVIITGETPVKLRHGIVEEFQTGKIRIAILNIQAAGIGWNMTAADRVLFIEHSWRDGDNQQASDRAHRIGRTKPVLVQYVVLKDSLDARRMEVVLRKRKKSL